MANIIWSILYFFASLLVVLFFSGIYRRKQIFGSLIYGIIVSLAVILIKWPIAGYFDWILGAKILSVFILVGFGFILLDLWAGKKLRKKQK
jgi:hypothetical protein